MKNFARYQLPAILYALLIFTLSSLSKLPSVHTGFRMIDKIAHFAEYFIFGALLAIAFAKSPLRTPLKVTLAISAAVGILYGAYDEIHQSFVPGREAAVADWLADAAGMLAAHLVFYYVRGKCALLGERARAVPEETR